VAKHQSPWVVGCREEFSMEIEIFGMLVHCEILKNECLLPITS